LKKKDRGVFMENDMIGANLKGNAPPPNKELRLPNKFAGLEITLNIGCKYNCYYCPQKKLLENYNKLPNSYIKILTFENFKKVLPKVAKNTVIGFCGMSEPFLNRDCAKMIRYAYDNGYKIMLATTLELMTDDDYELIRGIEFTDIYIHLPDIEMKSNFRADTNYKLKLKKVCNTMKVTFFSCHGELDREIKGILPKSIPLSAKMVNRAGNLKYQEFNDITKNGRILCLGIARGGIPASPIHMLLPNGYLTICCNDYGLKHIFGNLFIQEPETIFDSKEFKNYMYGFYDEKIDMLCRSCIDARIYADIKTMEYKLWQNNAISIGYLFNNIQNDIENHTFDESKYGIRPHQCLLVKNILEAKNICIFGLGELFIDNYYQWGWNKVISANLCSDNNPKKSKEITLYDNIKFVAPNDLRNYERLLIISYVKNFQALHKQLNDMGFYNIINIYDIYNLFD
jgi:hypothetical protein